MSSNPDATINVSLDKNTLAQVLSPVVNGAYAWTSISTIGGGTFTLLFDKGWLKYKQTSGYTKLLARYNPVPIGLIDDSSVLILAAIYRIVDINNAYFFFVEPRPGAASQVEGFYLQSGGTLTIRSEGSPTAGSGYSTSMTVSQDDIVVTRLSIANEGGTFYVMWAAGIYDWDNDTVTQKIQAYATLTTKTNFRYWTLIEADNTNMRIIVGPHILGWSNTIYESHTKLPGLGDIADIIKALKANGLVDPRTLDTNY